MAFISFKKNVIDTLWSWDNWSSRDALIFDDISLSSDELITIWSQRTNLATFDGVLLGTEDSSAAAYTTDPTNLFLCFPDVIALPGPMNDAVHNLIGYVTNQMPDFAAGTPIDFRT